MRRLNDDDGAVAIIVALLTVTLLGIGALVLDVGNLYWERRQLQAGADAAALSAAQDLAAGIVTAEATARTVADLNNVRGAYISTYAPEPAAGRVTVTTTTGSRDAAGTLTTALAGVLGIATTQTSATAVARWGPLGSGTSIPLTISMCDWQQITGGNVANLPSAPLTVRFHSTSPNPCTGPAGQLLPGGFGWLTPDGSGSCQTTTVNGVAAGKPGAGTPTPAGSTGCTTGFFAGLLGQTVLMPIHTLASDNGSNASFTIVGFAALEVQGYYFGGQFASSPQPCSGSDRCIRGRFVAYYDLENAPTTTGPAPYGATAVALAE